MVAADRLQRPKRLRDVTERAMADDKDASHCSSKTRLAPDHTIA